MNLHLGCVLGPACAWDGFFYLVSQASSPFLGPDMPPEPTGISSFRIRVPVQLCMTSCARLAMGESVLAMLGTASHLDSLDSTFLTLLDSLQQWNKSGRTNVTLSPWV